MDLIEPARFLVSFSHLLDPKEVPGPVLDVACGMGRNGLWLAKRGIKVIFCDRSEEALREVSKRAKSMGIEVDTWHVDLEIPGVNPFGEEAYGGILVFRYLHRPLIPCIRKALMPKGILLYETFTVDQVSFGRPCNPDHLLKPGELLSWFKDWDVIHYFEGVLEEPPRAMARLVCRKPGSLNPLSRSPSP